MSHRVYKFGGTSVATAGRIRRIVGLIQADSGAHVQTVVVSALGKAEGEPGVTDTLIRLIDLALDRSDERGTLFQDLRGRHRRVLADLATAEDLPVVLQHLDAIWDDL
ncbi:MAG: bifunctional aspartate kinase/homoserine dehydrogenase I, partial [Bacteroidota bacterium]